MGDHNDELIEFVCDSLRKDRQNAIGTLLKIRDLRLAMKRHPDDEAICQAVCQSGPCALSDEDWATLEPLADAIAKGGYPSRSELELMRKILIGYADEIITLYGEGEIYEAMFRESRESLARGEEE